MASLAGSQRGFGDVKPLITREEVEAAVKEARAQAVKHAPLTLPRPPTER